MCQGCEPCSVSGTPPPSPGADLSADQAVVIERPSWNLTVFKVPFGLLRLKGYTKGEHVLRFEAIVHNTAPCTPAGSWRSSPPSSTGWPPGRQIHQHARLRRCRLPPRRRPGPATDTVPDRCHPSRRRGHQQTTHPRRTGRLAAVLALAVSPDGFTIADLAAKVRSLTGQSEHGYTTRQAAYDPRKLRGKDLVVEPGRPRSSPASADPARADFPPRTPTSTVTTRTSARTCAPSSATSRSTPRHRQQVVGP
jgi:hypothetical protein